MSTHSVENHLKVTAEDYDKAIRIFVPHYDEMLQTGVDLVNLLAKKSPRVLDLGGGTGALTEAVLKGVSDSTVTLIDIDPDMLSEAKRRLNAESKRVSFMERSFLGALPKCDVVVASLALHHVPTLAQKIEVYAAIAESLRPGGVFVNLDATLSFDERIRKLTFDRWAVDMGQYGVSVERAYQHFAEWAAEDYYIPLADELQCLREAGFPHPECFWRRGPVAVFGGLISV